MDFKDRLFRSEVSLDELKDVMKKEFPPSNKPGAADLYLFYVNVLFACYFQKDRKRKARSQNDLDLKNFIVPLYTELVKCFANQEGLGYHIEHIFQYATLLSIVQTKLEMVHLYNERELKRLTYNQLLAEQLRGLYTHREWTSLEPYLTYEMLIPESEIHRIVQIGKGAQGIVFKGVFNKRVVSIKDCKGDHVYGLLREYDLMKQIDSKDVIRVEGYNHLLFDKKDRRAFMVMEYANEGDLYGKIEKSIVEQVPLPRALIYKWFRQLIQAVKACHEKNIYHLDIKPENILVSDDQLKLVDFGVAQQRPDGMVTATGTPSYYPPEFFRESYHSGEKVDVFLMGVVFFMLIARVPPFNATDTNDWFYTQIKNNHLRTYWKTVSTFANFRDEEEVLLSNMFQEDPTQRISLDALQRHFDLYFSQIISIPELPFQILYGGKQIRKSSRKSSRKRNRLPLPLFRR